MTNWCSLPLGMLSSQQANWLHSYRMPIRSVQKPTHRRPVAIVPRAQLTPQLVEDRIVLDLGEDRFWLLPRDLTGRTLLFTMRHGISRVESGTYRVGRRLANVLDPERGVPKADAVGAALARMLGVVGQQLDFLHIHNYLDPRTFVHLVSRSPNTRQLYERVIAALMQAQTHHAEALPPVCDPALDSQDFGWVTGLEKKVEAEEAAKAFGVDVQTAKRLIKHPLYSYPGGHSFFDVYVDIVDGFRRLGQSHQGKAVCVYSHSSTLRALMIYLDPRPFREAFTEFGEYKEGQDNVVLLAYEQGLLSGYSTAVGLSARERAVRETWVKVERERRDRVTLKPRQIKRIVALVSGGDFAGAGAALKELRVTGNRFGLEVHFVRHGFLGLANNWINAVTEHDTRGMGSHASSPIGSSRFEDFKDEQVQQATMRHLRPYMEDGALVVIGGDGSLRGARALYEGFGVQAVGIPGTIDNNLAGTTSLGFHSAVSLANQSIESLKATSSAMGSVFFVEIMGAGPAILPSPAPIRPELKASWSTSIPIPTRISTTSSWARSTARLASRTKAICLWWRNRRPIAITRMAACAVLSSMSPAHSPPGHSFRRALVNIASPLRQKPRSSGTRYGGRPRLPRTRPSDKIWPMKRFAVLSRSRSGWSGACWPIAGRALSRRSHSTLWHRSSSTGRSSPECTEASFRSEVNGMSHFIVKIAP